MVTKLDLPSVYWINLDRSPARRARMEAQFAAYGVRAHRVAAIDGAKPVQPYLRCRTNNPFEAACLASHLTAIKRAYLAGEEEAVFMEDDASFELVERFPATFAQVRAALPERYGALWLGYGDSPKHLDQLFLQPGLVVPVPPRLTLWSTVAYVLQRRAMHLLLTAYDRERGFDVTAFQGRHEADTLLLGTLSQASEIDPPSVLRVPLFLYEGRDSEIHTEDVQRQRRARAFILSAYDELVEGTYRSRFGLRGRARMATSGLKALFK